MCVYGAVFFESCPNFVRLSPLKWKKSDIFGKILFSGRALTLQEGHYGGWSIAGRGMLIHHVCAHGPAFFKFSSNSLHLNLLSEIMTILA